MLIALPHLITYHFTGCSRSLLHLFFLLSVYWTLGFYCYSLHNDIGIKSQTF